MIDPERTIQIQTALIKMGYMSGEPTGKWDNTTQAALEKLQGDNGWQTKLVPDSRAIIKLGLGPGNTTAAEVTASANPGGAGVNESSARSGSDMTFPTQK